MNKKALAVAISSALAVPMAAQAVSFNLSGQVNRAIMFADDGVASDVHFVDNTASNTRFRMTGSEDIGNGMTAGFSMEFASMVNDSFTITIKNPGDVATTGGLGNGFLLRKNEVWFSGNWGQLSLGQGPTSTDGMADADLSNTWLSDHNAVSFGGAITFRTSAGGTGAGFAPFSVYTYFDGHSRRARVRYDTPSFGPLTVSVDASENNTWGAKAYVYTSIAGGDLSAAFGYADGDNRFGRTDWGGSASFLFSQGTSISVGWQERDFVAAGRDSSTHWRVKLGHRWGNNAVSISYGQVDDLGANGTESDKIGIGFVHTIPKPKVELYAGYMNLSLDDDGTGAGQPSYEDVDVFHIGSRVKFD
jgi:predicted porin